MKPLERVAGGATMLQKTPDLGEREERYDEKGR